ncbi:MAG: hypothetical protein JNL87_00165 [Burkholderiaceae bacterium]|nr:hypothetical protein [Burkholderiaceae bacterium]
MKRPSARRLARRCGPGAIVLLLAACSSAPPPPDWQLAAHASLDQAVAAYLRGDGRAFRQEFDRARSEIARTGRADLLARAELTGCAVRVASLEFGPCDGFETLRLDAAAPELAYADYLAGRLPAAQAAQTAQLPAAQRGVAAAVDADAAAAALAQVADPVSRLVAAGVLLQTGRANPAVIAQAADTASAQGWRRPLLAWLGVQLQRAEQAGEADAAQRLRRRIALIAGPG